jgi:dTDP-4-dehydrorhamnose reductase
VTGANGQLGRDLVDALSGRVPVGALADDPRTGSLGARLPCDVVPTDLPDLDITDRAAVQRLVDRARPDVVIHGAAYTAVDACEQDPDLAFAVNAMGTRNVAEAARAVGAHLVYVSTDYVFDGNAERPYLEWDPPCPVSVYGRSKYAGELECGPADTIVRTSWVCGFHGSNMVKTVLRLAAQPGELRFVDDQRGSPTFTADLSGVLARLASERRPGRFHVTNQGITTWFGLARQVLASAGDDPERVRPVATSQLDPPRPAPRPANSALDNAALRLAGLGPMPPWEDGLRRLVEALTTAGSTSGRPA